MICSICKKETPCEHNGRKGAIYYYIDKAGKLAPSSWDGLFDAKEISVQPAGGFTLGPLMKTLNKDHCRCGHKSEVHSDEGKCFGQVYETFESGPYPCGCPKFIEKLPGEVCMCRGGIFPCKLHNGGPR